MREQLGRGQPAAHRNQSAARAGLEAGARAGHHREAAADRGKSLRRMPHALRGSEAATWSARDRISGKLAPGARPRLLHAHDVRNHRAGTWLAERRVRRRALRWPGGTAGRTSHDEGHRIRHWHRSAHSFLAGSRELAKRRADWMRIWPGLARRRRPRPLALHGDCAMRVSQSSCPPWK